MSEIVQIGKISARGQIAIPSDIRREMDLEEGNNILFLLENDTLLIKKVNSKTFAQITAPLKEAMSKTPLKEKDVPDLVQRFRKTKR